MSNSPTRQTGSVNPTFHRRGAGMSHMLGFGEFVMGPTEIGGAAKQVHPAVQSPDARSRMPTLTREARESLAKGAIQALDKGGIEHVSSTRKLKQLLGPLQQTASHLARDLDHALFLRMLDHRAKVQFWPNAQAGSTHPHRFFDLLSKGTPNAAWIGCPPVGQYEQRAPRQCTAAHLLHQRIGSPFVSAHLDRSRQPESRRHHHG